MNLYQIIKYKLALLLGVSISICSCTKVIELPLSNNTGQLVIEGAITNLSGQQVIKLSRNISFYSNNANPAVTGATVVVNDQLGTNYVFSESSPGSYTSSFTGVPGYTYTLQVISNGTTYSASSTMPQPVTLNTISSKQNTFDKAKKTITIAYQDPAGISNQYRFVLRVNNKQVNSFFPGSDKYSDGKFVIDDLNQNDITIKIGDNVSVEMHCIDLPMYRYWYALVTQSSNNGITPANPSNNISPAALGYFSAHTVDSKMMQIIN